MIINDISNEEKYILQRSLKDASGMINITKPESEIFKIFFLIFSNITYEFNVVDF